jgi:hypothetical protein
MHSHGGISKGEQGLLDANMHLLHQRVLQLHERQDAMIVEPSQPPASTVRRRRRTKRVFDNRACQHCDTHFTSQWRTGPSGPSSYRSPLRASVSAWSLLKFTTSFQVSFFPFLIVSVGFPAVFAWCRLMIFGHT